MDGYQRTDDLPAHGQSEYLHGFLLSWADRSPDAAAVVGLSARGEPETVTYDGLRRQASQYTEELRGLGLDIGDRVVLEAHNSASAIAMLIACSTLGLVFVPVSPGTPPERLAAISAAATPALHLRAAGGDGTEEGDIPRDTGLALFGPDRFDVLRAPCPRVRYRSELTSTDPAYIIFTSGTTGSPKGVVMSHRAVLAFFRGMLTCRIAAPGDRVASTSPLQFDFSLLDTGLALGSGAAVVPVPRDLLHWPRRFLRFLRATGATQVNGAPSIWRGVLRHEPELLAELPLGGILFSGEEFPIPELRQLQRAQPGARIVNCYGSTESVACSFTDVPNPLPANVERLSIGRAHAGAEMVLIHESGRAVTEPDVPGEIHLRSPALFTGYWNAPEATARVLVPDPLQPRSGQVVYRTGDLATRGPDGELYYRGRTDSQVKIRGNRVDLGEVDRTLTGLPGVALAVTLLMPREGEDLLSAFIVREKGAEPLEEAELRTSCAAVLPDYMIPQELHVLDELPLNSHGKVDRTGLRSRFGNGRAQEVRG